MLRLRKTENFDYGRLYIEGFKMGLLSKLIEIKNQEEAEAQADKDKETQQSPEKPTK